MLNSLYYSRSRFRRGGGISLGNFRIGYYVPVCVFLLLIMITSILVFKGWLGQGVGGDRGGLHSPWHSSRGRVALTFDDGPSLDHTPAILDILHRSDVPATFFVLGSKVQNLEGARNRMTAEAQKAQYIIDETRARHLVGNHTWDHKNIKKMDSNTMMNREVKPTSEIIKRTYGQESVDLFRPPYGAISSEKMDEIQRETGMQKVLWNIETRDWDKKNSAATMVAEVKKSLDKGGDAVIIMHDGVGNTKETIKALPEIIKVVKDHNFEIVPLSEIMRNGGIRKRS